MGSNSAVGVALRNSSRIGSERLSRDQAMNFLRSTLLIEPIGLSYLVVSWMGLR